MRRKMGWPRTGWAFLDISGVGFLQHAFDMNELTKVVSTKAYENIFRSNMYIFAVFAVIISISLKKGPFNQATKTLTLLVLAHSFVVLGAPVPPKQH